ncbi:MAG: hypothetical protein HY394_01595 [Candidatus Diapherotrites archaeon]|nr:hypothetical protein [Candidatus Diapherotrites archaeon]
MALRIRFGRRKPAEKPLRFLAEKRKSEPKKGRPEERNFNFFGRKFESAESYNRELEEADAELQKAALDERKKILEEKQKAGDEEAPKRNEETARKQMRLLATQIEQQEKSIAKIDDMITKVKKSNPTWEAIKEFGRGFNPMLTIFKPEKSEHGKFYLISPWKLPINFIGIFFHKPGFWKLRKLRSIRSQMVETYDRMTNAFNEGRSSREGTLAFKISEKQLRVYARAGRLGKVPTPPPKHDEGKEDREEG